MKRRCLPFLLFSLLLLGAVACSSPGSAHFEDRVATAERFFRGVYGGQPAVVDELAAEEIVLSYPVFQTLFGAPTIEGREAVREFAARFARRWTGARITVREAVAQGDTVVLFWTFQARNVALTQSGQAPAGSVLSWGGMTLYHFDEDGRIVLETGYEGEPRPVEPARTTSNEETHE